MMKEHQRFELLVKDILEKDLRELRQLCELRIYHNRKVEGKASGHEHQIDILLELKITSFKIMVVVECKKYKHKVGIDEILEFSARIQDIGVHKGVMVSTVGFQEGALKIAEANRIALVLAGHFGVLEGIVESPMNVIRRHKQFIQDLRSYLTQLDIPVVDKRLLDMVRDSASPLGMFWQPFNSWQPDSVKDIDRMFGLHSPCFRFLGRTVEVLVGSKGFLDLIALEMSLSCRKGDFNASKS